MVQWLLRHDHADRFRFAPQQSAFAEAALIRHGIDREALLASNSAYLLLDLSLPTERLLRRSDVGIAVLLDLGGGWRILGRFFQAVPRFMRDAVYSFVANNRFRISGRYETCPLPSATQRAKFLS
jgi:predicted DCC family thiol-disulfide oxidoreductase YuxK